VAAKEASSIEIVVLLTYAIKDSCTYNNILLFPKFKAPALRVM
jgi:hypothetical protein